VHLNVPLPEGEPLAHLRSLRIAKAAIGPENLKVVIESVEERIRQVHHPVEVTGESDLEVPIKEGIGLLRPGGVAIPVVPAMIIGWIWRDQKSPTLPLNLESKAPHLAVKNNGS